MIKETLVALSVATLASGAVVLPTATAKAADSGIQLAAGCNPCNPCATAAANPCNPCNPCAAKLINPCNPCNPCAAGNPCGAANPCNPCATK